jgi:hypothetical protein
MVQSALFELGELTFQFLIPEFQVSSCLYFDIVCVY